MRYAYPGVRFSQGKAIVVRVRDDDAPRAADGTVAITGARVVEALADDGVDVARWRARVALDHPASASVLAHVDARDNPGATGSNDAAWRREPAYQSFVDGDVSRRTTSSASAPRHRSPRPARGRTRRRHGHD